MRKYIVKFEYKDKTNEWIEETLDNNKEYFTEKEANTVVTQLKYDDSCVKQKLRIEQAQ